MTDPSIKIGRYMAIMRPPIKSPNTDIMMGSISELRLSTALSTAASYGVLLMARGRKNCNLIAIRNNHREHKRELQQKILTN